MSIAVVYTVMKVSANAETWAYSPTLCSGYLACDIPHGHANREINHACSEALSRVQYFNSSESNIKRKNIRPGGNYSDTGWKCTTIAGLGAPRTPIEPISFGGFWVCQVRLQNSHTKRLFILAKRAFKKHIAVFFIYARFYDANAPILLWSARVTPPCPPIPILAHAHNEMRDWIDFKCTGGVVGLS